MDQEPTLDSNLQPTLFPETILAPAPIHPNCVRFASNPVDRGSGGVWIVDLGYQRLISMTVFQLPDLLHLLSPTNLDPLLSINGTSPLLSLTTPPSLSLLTSPAVSNSYDFPKEYTIGIRQFVSLRKPRQNSTSLPLVCDPEEYDFGTPNTVPEDRAVFFVMATTEKNLQDESFEFSQGAHDLSGLKYVAFGLGNKTYEHYAVISQYVDTALEKMGAT
ncbi:uncharacterized protein C8R40DRAFT_1167751 [Lentinula edodes]|uniref:uncharacterized protein n=1 Tax=Lentinula edodes TaxID=5353 RepID=UPI001E8DAF3B|nr:uncharacterized protein C8R40DRAFT_1167751 [Lentinula edodes]KAH7878326.1 hypothetical protein C8R40DRAFT_1167751 [Lentinula edodes]KAJ3912058.1 hypothetical protein F5877DRAFT_85220 [Lentinula edodes]